MATPAKLVLGVLAGLLSCQALAERDSAYEAWLVRVGDYETLRRQWWLEAFRGDAESQERVAELDLGPHGREAKAPPYEGVHFLFRAAVEGRRKAMLHLADALSKGELGLRKLPAAARCWSSAPAGFEERLACVRQTDFADPDARPRCTDLALFEVQNHPANRDGADMARLCLANKTPAILVPGVPPSKADMDRVEEYKRHGIEWAITGDVITGSFEAFRRKFNDTMTAGLEAEHGKGYARSVSAQVEARVCELDPPAPGTPTRCPDPSLTTHR